MLLHVEKSSFFMNTVFTSSVWQPNLFSYSHFANPSLVSACVVFIFLNLLSLFLFFFFLFLDFCSVLWLFETTVMLFFLLPSANCYFLSVVAFCIFNSFLRSVFFFFKFGLYFVLSWLYTLYLFKDREFFL